MKFIADSMLGRLTRWLRLSGYDVFYAKDLKDEEILEKAEQEERILLTRDKKLTENADSVGVAYSLIRGNGLLEQLRQLTGEQDILVHDTPEVSRCPLCNSKVKAVAKENVKERVPDSVFQVFEEFWICEDCGKIYWHGGHWKKIKDMVMQI
ncbi:MAG: Mut7-C RNAse domain-containing protein [Candidatus Hydrothermarchaeales archaeon]